MDKSQFELLAPGGDIESIKAAIIAGADAVYCGLDRFNARNRATNLSFDELNEVVNIAHQYHCKIFVTLNIMILESEISAVVRLINRLVKTEIDGVIVQDLGLAYILSTYFPDIDVHASTQMNTHNDGQIEFISQFGISRVNLSRELNISEIKRLAQFGYRHNVLTEVFVHGSYCIGFSGLCYVSSVRNGASGNRGRCSQPCRDEYQLTNAGVRHPLNMKDNSAFSDLKELADAGVYSLKVEGRIKGSHYVYTVVDNWRRQIDQYCQTGELLTDDRDLYLVYNRDFSDGYLKGDIGQEMYIDNPRDHSVAHFANEAGDESEEKIRQLKKSLYDEKTAIIEKVAQETAALSSDGSEISQEVKSRKGIHESVVLDSLTSQSQALINNPLPELSILLSSPEDIQAAGNTNTDKYYQLPDGLDYYLEDMVQLFQDNPDLTPWFPAILIDKDYDAAVEFLERIKPAQIVTNNLGVAWAARERGIGWIAGPQLNIANSFALKVLKEKFACSGAFISDEINKRQMQRLVIPQGFRLFYTIYHPVNIMTSRQCLFQQSAGCKKVKIKKGCIPKCSKHTSIINLKDASYIVDKQKGGYSCLYSQYHCLNTEITSELSDLYSGYLIDLRSIKTETRVQLSLPEMITGFERLLAGDSDAKDYLSENLSPTINTQYERGL